MMVLAPQLRQSLEMLQLPLMELRAMIQQEMEHNPTIEDVVSPHEVSFDDLATRTVGEGTARSAGEDAEAGGQGEKPSGAEDEKPLDFDERSIDTLTAMDDEWRDYYFDEQQNNPYTVQDEERRRYMFDSLRQPVSLQHHLLEQLRMTDLGTENRQLGELIIGSLNDNGFLVTDLAELAAQTAAPLARIEDVLKVIQTFDPPGIAARDLRECLLIQIRQSNAPEAPLAEAIIANRLQDLST